MEEKQISEDIDKQFKALSDSTRRKILDLLQDSTLTAGEIADLCQTTKPNISQHLKVLKASGLIQEEKKGLYIFYSLCTFDFQQTKKGVRNVLNIKEKILFDIQQLAYKKNCEPVVGATDSQDDGTFYIMQGTDTIISFHYSFRLTSFYINFEIPVYLQKGGNFNIQYEDTKAIENLYETISEELQHFLLKNEEHKENNKKLRFEVRKYMTEKTRNMEIFLTKDALVIQQLTNWISDFIENKAVEISNEERNDLINDTIIYLTSLDKIHTLLDDTEITEIMINSVNGVWIEKKGELTKTNITFADHDEVMQLARKIATLLGKRIDSNSVSFSGKLPNGSVASIVLPIMSSQGITIVISNFSNESLKIDDLIRFNSIDETSADFLRKAVEAGLNIIFTGGIFTGKNTNLNAYSCVIPSDERIIIIEDNEELNLPHENVVKLKTQPFDLDKNLGITTNDCLKTALELRPDRLILSELHFGSVHQYIEICNNRYNGIMTTMFAYTPDIAIKNLQEYISDESPLLSLQFINQEICDAVDLIVHLQKLKDGSRKISEITQLNGYIKGNNKIILQPLFKWKETEKKHGHSKGEFVYTGYELSEKIAEKFESVGFSNPFEHLSFHGTEKELDTIEQDLPRFATKLADLLLSGLTFHQAIQYANDNYDDTTTKILYSVSRYMDSGMALKESLIKLKSNYNSPLLHFFINGIIVHEKNFEFPIRQMSYILNDYQKLLQDKTRTEKENITLSDQWKFMEFIDLLSCILPASKSVIHAIKSLPSDIDNRFIKEFKTATEEIDAGKIERTALFDAATRLEFDSAFYTVREINESQKIGRNMCDTLDFLSKEFRKMMKDKK